MTSKTPSGSPGDVVSTRSLRGGRHLHPTRAFPAAGEEVGAEVTARAKVAVHLAEPPRQTAGVREGRPQVADVAVEPVLEADHAGAVCCAQDTERAYVSWGVDGHRSLLRSRLPRAISVCRASSCWFLAATCRASHSLISSSGCGCGRRL